MNKLTKTCLNCNEKLQGDFCSYCGQSAQTDRFTFKHVFTHGFLLAIFHFNKGLFFSLKELFTRPGHSTREYINGKRVTHINYFSLLVILILVFSMVEQATPFHFYDLSDGDREIFEAIDKALRKYPKFVYIGIIPLLAVFSYLFFPKAKQNYAENIVLNSFKTAAVIAMNILFISFVSFIKDISIIRKADTLFAWISTAYGTWFYYQYFSPFYANKFLLIVKSLLSTILPGILVAIGIVLYFTLNGSGQMSID
jgi:Protein of unknown function (DUF3667)